MNQKNDDVKTTDTCHPFSPYADKCLCSLYQKNRLGLNALVAFCWHFLRLLVRGKLVHNYSY